MTVVPRMLPALDDVNRAFWTGGATGSLLVQRCIECRRWQHPPASTCAACGGVVEPEPVSGRGTVFTFTVNHHPYNPAVPTPYVIAVVELDEQPDLRLPTNIVNCAVDDVHSGLAVRVVFEQHDEVFVPLFEPVDAARAGRS